MAKEKIRDVEKPKIQEQIKERYQPRKEGRSTFDKVLEQNKILQKSPTKQQAMGQKAEHSETRVARHQDQGERGKDRQSDEKEQERGKQKAKDERKSGAETEQRVAGKGRGKGGQDKGSGQGKGKGQGFGGSHHKKSVSTLKKGAFSKAAQAATAANKFASELKAQMKTAHLSKEFVQKLVNQIVKFVKTGLNKEGDQEVRLDLHERIFRGLQLRVTEKDGKVAIHFKTSNAEVRELFAGSSENIQKELEAKGVSIHEIKVT
jgi:hypothetical protein